MIEQRHSSYVPHPGTLRKHHLCPSWALHEIVPARHCGRVLPNQIKRYRKEAGLSQEGLAGAIGTTRNMLVKLERGERKLDADWLENLIIAPEGVLPSADELAEMLDASQRTLPAGLPYSEWPRAIAEGLHMRLRTLAADRASNRTAD